MLHKKTFLFVAYLIAFWCAVTYTANAAVIASIKPLGFITAAIADGVTDTQVLLPDGASEHDYALRPSDIKRIKNADLVVWVGPEMEAFMTRPLSQISAQHTLQLASLNSIKTLLMMGDKNTHHVDESSRHLSVKRDQHHAHSDYNLHIWVSPEMAWLSAVAIHDKLVELMPENSAKLDENLNHFKSELNATDKQVRATIAPLKGKGYFVFHDAYGYFEKHYGLKSLGYFTINPAIQPGAERLNQIRSQLVKNKAVCVFAEPQFRPAVINAVARGTHVRSGTLDPLGMGIVLGKDSYRQFLVHLSEQYASCLNGE